MFAVMPTLTHHRRFTTAFAGLAFAAVVMLAAIPVDSGTVRPASVVDEATTTASTSTTYPQARPAVPVPQPTTTTTAAPTTTTTAAPTTTTASSSGGSEGSPFVATTPEEAAQGFLAAWTVGDSESASLYAEQSVITELFVRPTGGSGSTFQGCSDNGDATFNCFLSYEGGGTNLTVSAPPGGRYRVTGAFQIAD